MIFFTTQYGTGQHNHKTGDRNNVYNIHWISI